MALSLVSIALRIGRRPWCGGTHTVLWLHWDRVRFTRQKEFLHKTEMRPATLNLVLIFSPKWGTGSC